jgi:hypothetical protein
MILRSEMVKWLKTNSLPSVYEFDLTKKQNQQITGRWPWGEHHTELLGHLEAAAIKWWTNYDPADRTTAPRNEDVTSWLMKEYKLSEKMASAIASILRPDDLPTGPRT